jgi:DNA (cytosine-5)-methyltransferase 1
MFTADAVKEHFSRRNDCSLMQQEKSIDVLIRNVPEKYWLSNRLKRTILANGSGRFVAKSEIDLDIVRPLCATMSKMHRACQDNYFSDLYIDSEGQYRPSERMNKGELATLPIRKLTPKEAFLLQGFPQDFANNARLAGVADGAMYKQAGNAVSVNTIYAVLYYLIQNRIIKE